MIPLPEGDAERDRKRVLVIDDEVGCRLSLRFLLSDEFDVLCAESVDEGLTFLDTEDVSIVLTDVRMPGRTGIEGLRAIRELDPDLPVILLTGYHSKEAEQEAMSLGARAFMSKPFDCSDMREAIRQHAR